MTGILVTKFKMGHRRGGPGADGGRYLQGREVLGGKKGAGGGEGLAGSFLPAGCSSSALKNAKSGASKLFQELGDLEQQLRVFFC